MDFLKEARLARTPSEYAEEKMEIRADLRFCCRQIVESLSCLKEEDATKYTEVDYHWTEKPRPRITNLTNLN